MDWQISIEEFEDLIPYTFEDIAERCGMTLDELLTDMASEYKGG